MAVVIFTICFHGWNTYRQGTADLIALLRRWLGRGWVRVFVEMV